METINTTATVKETSAAMRKALRVEFPGVKISVRIATGTAYGYIHVSYVGDLDQYAVQRATDPFVSMQFDTMDECYRPTGVTAWSCRGVLVHQRTA